MSIAKFQNYKQNNYEDVCQFLIRISQNSKKSINWNWARWEWMYFHQDFDIKKVESIGLWFDNEKLVAIATYDYYNGESVILVDNEHKYLYNDIILYSVKTFSDQDGLGIAVNDDDTELTAKLIGNGFQINEGTENILVKDLSENLNYQLANGLTIKHIEGTCDAMKFNEVLWKGMDHEGDVQTDDATIKSMERMLSAKHINYKLINYVDDHGTWAAFCGCWFMKGTDYAYVEPVCTLPDYRKKGIGKAVVYESLLRCKKAGAKKAFVISDMEFYKKLGFVQHSHYTFYWKK
ncbi:MAG: GNAT family N-acetyltransferase [Treponema sp. CETP13]|nr:MAG: GNAT family N-acetyltransferase [Treponema sp. CETP13]